MSIQVFSPSTPLMARRTFFCVSIPIVCKTRPLCRVVLKALSGAFVGHLVAGKRVTVYKAQERTKLKENYERNKERWICKVNQSVGGYKVMCGVFVIVVRRGNGVK